MFSRHAKKFEIFLKIWFNFFYGFCFIFKIFIIDKPNLVIFYKLWFSIFINFKNHNFSSMKRYYTMSLYVRVKVFVYFQKQKFNSTLFIHSFKKLHINILQWRVVLYHILEGPLLVYLGIYRCNIYLNFFFKYASSNFLTYFYVKVFFLLLHI